ncbi:41048_t:CDS:2, partial [Gigaspora margarita]
KAKQKLPKNGITVLAGVNLDSHISQNAILQIYNPIGDSHCGFQLLPAAIFKEKDNNILGYDVNGFMVVLSHVIPGNTSKHWFYAPECAQLASDTYNVLIAVFAEDSEASLFFLPFGQKPDCYRKHIILH